MNLNRSAEPRPRRLSPALALGLCAVLLAAAGSATAASLITGSQVKNSSLTGADIRNRSLTPADFRGSVRGPAGPQGMTGLPGAPGSPGPAGVPGLTGLARITIAQAEMFLCSGAVGCAIDSAFAVCPAGTKAFGGGVSTDAYYGDFAGSIGRDSTTGQTGYVASADNFGSSSSASVTAFAYCSPDVQSITFPNGVAGRGSASTDSAVDSRRAMRLAK